MYNDTPSPVCSFYLNSLDIVITISIFTDADVVVCYYVLIVRQMYMNYCNITTFITKNLFIDSILFWIHFYCGNCCNFQLSPSTKNSSKKSVTEMEIVFEHGIIHPSNSLSTKNSSVIEMEYEKANENMTIYKFIGTPFARLAPFCICHMRLMIEYVTLF